MGQWHRYPLRCLVSGVHRSSTPSQFPRKKKIAERKKEYIERALASHCEQLGMPIHENEMCPISVSFMKQWYLLYFHINPWVWGHIRDSIQKTDDIEIKKSAIRLHLIYAVLITPSFGSNYLAKILWIQSFSSFLDCCH